MLEFARNRSFTPAFGALNLIYLKEVDFMNQHKGISLKLVNSKTGTSSKEIINSHYKIAKDKGSVWFSTAIQISTKRIIDKVLFVAHNGNEEVYVLADVIDIKVQKDPFIVEEKDLIPANYQNEAKISWLLIKNMKKVDSQYADEATVYYTDGSEKKLRELMQQPRINRAYYTWIDSSEDNLI